jgi:hypothetical protein
MVSSIFFTSPIPVTESFGASSKCEWPIQNINNNKIINKIKYSSGSAAWLVWLLIWSQAATDTCNEPYQAYVLTLLPGRVFQVFQVVGGEEKREKREFIDNLFKSIISVYICFTCFSPSKHNHRYSNSSWFLMSEDLTWPDYKLGIISVRSQDLANRNQDDTHLDIISRGMCFAVRHGIRKRVSSHWHPK